MRGLQREASEKDRFLATRPKSNWNELGLPKNLRCTFSRERPTRKQVVQSKRRSNSSWTCYPAPGGHDIACDGTTTGGLADAVMEAQLQNVLVMKSAGNNGHTGGCSLSDPGDLPSIFSVGSMLANPTSCTDANYATCGLSSSSSRGGIDATTPGGSPISNALAGVAVVAPGCQAYRAYGYHPTPTAPDEEWFGFKTSGSCTTSFAVPQVAGAALLAKDLSQGLDPSWGAGRIQMRRFDASGHVGTWGWEYYNTVFTGSAQTHTRNLWGSGSEPASLAQIKTYMMFFERDAAGIANLDLALRQANCASPDLVVDASWDVRKMVRLGPTAAGQQLCVRTYAANIPSGETRKAHVFSYYSFETTMR